MMGHGFGWTSLWICNASDLTNDRSMCRETIGHACVYFPPYSQPKKRVAGWWQDRRFMMTEEDYLKLLTWTGRVK